MDVLSYDVMFGVAVDVLIFVWTVLWIFLVRDGAGNSRKLLKKMARIEYSFFKASDNCFGDFSALLAA